MRAAATIVLALLSSSTAAADPVADARLRSEITAVRPLGADADELDLDLDTRLDVGFAGLIRPETAGRLTLRDRRDLNEAPQGSVLRDSWDERPGRDQERLEQAWLEFGDRLAIRAGRQFDWPGAPVRYDGASLRLRRLAQPFDAFVFAGNRVGLDALEDEWSTFDLVAGGRVEARVGQSTLQVSSLYRDRHLLDLGFWRRLGRRRYFDDVVLSVGYSQLDLRPRDARAGVEVALRRIPIRLRVSADARLLRTEDELAFDYTTSRWQDFQRDSRLRLEPLPPSVLLHARVDVHPTPFMNVGVSYSRRQLFSPSDTTAWSFSHHELALTANVLHAESTAYGSLSASYWIPDVGDPPQGASALETDGEAERNVFRLSASAGIGQRRSFGASAGIALRRFDHVAPLARVDNVQAVTLLAQLEARPMRLLEITLWGAYDEALLVLDPEVDAAVAAGLAVEVRAP